eukprot:2874436-Rhodomonas_salina.1
MSRNAASDLASAITASTTATGAEESARRVPSQLAFSTRTDTHSTRSTLLECGATAASRRSEQISRRLASGLHASSADRASRASTSIASTSSITLSTRVPADTSYLSVVPPRDGAVDARLDPVQHVDNHVLGQRVLRVVHRLTPHVPWVQPQPDLARAPDLLCSACQVLLVVTPQLTRRNGCCSSAEHRLHEVLGAGARDRVGPDKVGPLLVDDGLVLEHVLVDTAEEGLGEGRLGARRVERRRQDQRRIARVRVVLIDRARVRPRVDLHHQHVLEEDLQVFLVLRDLEHHRDQAVLQRLSRGADGLVIVAGKVCQPARVRRLGADDHARLHVLRQVHAALVRIAPRHEVVHNQIHAQLDLVVPSAHVHEPQVKLDVDHVGIQIVGERDVEAAEVIVGDRNLRAHLSPQQVLGAAGLVNDRLEDVVHLTVAEEITVDCDCVEFDGARRVHRLEAVVIHERDLR